jgi:hypothetical protein
MRKSLTITVVLLGLVAVAGLALAQGGKRFTIAMTGAAEVPGPGDPDGSGTAILQVNAGRGIITYELSVANISTATAAHIHRGPAGEAGPVVVPLRAPSNGAITDTVHVDKALAQEILRTPSAFYVNVHNGDFPAGAVRGQLSGGGSGLPDSLKPGGGSRPDSSKK